MFLLQIPLRCYQTSRLTPILNLRRRASPLTIMTSPHQLPRYPQVRTTSTGYPRLVALPMNRAHFPVNPLRRRAMAMTTSVGYPRLDWRHPLPSQQPLPSKKNVTRIWQMVSVGYPRLAHLSLTNRGTVLSPTLTMWVMSPKHPVMSTMLISNPPALL